MCKNEGETTALTPEQKLYQERLNRVETAIHLGTPDKVPVFAFFSSYMQRAYGSSYADIYYDFDKAGQAAVQFHKDHPQLDIGLYPRFTSGKANEIAGSSMIDWPGRPGTRVSPYSSHQIIERELMLPEEYPEMLNDFTGFMLRKYIPRAYQNLPGTAGLQLTPTIVLNTTFLSPCYSDEIQETFQKIRQIGEEDAKAAAASAKYSKILEQMGFPPMMTGSSEAPYDKIGRAHV